MARSPAVLLEMGKKKGAEIQPLSRWNALLLFPMALSDSVQQDYDNFLLKIKKLVRKASKLQSPAIRQPNFISWKFRASKYQTGYQLALTFTFIQNCGKHLIRHRNKTRTEAECTKKKSISKMAQICFFKG